MTTNSGAHGLPRGPGGRRIGDCCSYLRNRRLGRFLRSRARSDVTPDCLSRTKDEFGRQRRGPEVHPPRGLFVGRIRAVRHAGPGPRTLVRQLSGIPDEDEGSAATEPSALDVALSVVRVRAPLLPWSQWVLVTPSAIEECGPPQQGRSRGGGPTSECERVLDFCRRSRAWAVATTLGPGGAGFVDVKSRVRVPTDAAHLAPCA